MKVQIDNCNIIELKTLPSPREVKTKLPLTDRAADVVVHTRQAIRQILAGHDVHRLVVVIGPCSIHDQKVALEYAERLKRIADATHEHLLIVMRTYFEKPRTTVGWKGLINDPHLDGTCDIAAGYEVARRILLSINEIGLPCACEFLDPVTPQYIADLVSWVAIGARTTESQTHREMASGLSMPIGFKNGTDGGLQVAINAMVTAHEPHSFVGINADGITSIVKTNGNPDRHIVLRGGGGKSNYAPEDVAKAVKAVSVHHNDIVRSVMVDCSHDNSNKDHRHQADVARCVVQQLLEGQRAIMGLMIESNLHPGSQKWKAGVTLDHGVSITDACIGWDETEALLHELAGQVASTPRPTSVS